MPTDRQIEAGLDCYAEGGCMGLSEDERHEVVIDILTAAEQAQEAQPVAYRYRYTDPGTGKSVWRDKNGLWNGQLPSGSQALYTSPTIPEGWRLVPIEPTLAQLSAAQDAWLADPLRQCSTIYRAMLAAAPNLGDNK